MRKQKEAKSFSGFCWCLNRPNLLVTHDNESPDLRFWNLPQDSIELSIGEEQRQPDAVSSKDNSIMQFVTEQSDEEFVHPSEANGILGGSTVGVSPNWVPPA